MESKPTWLRGDIVGGILAALVSIPGGMAYGTIAFAPLGPQFITFGVIAGLMSVVFVNIGSAFLSGNQLLIYNPEALSTVILASALPSAQHRAWPERCPRANDDPRLFLSHRLCRWPVSAPICANQIGQFGKIYFSASHCWADQWRLPYHHSRANSPLAGTIARSFAHGCGAPCDVYAASNPTGRLGHHPGHLKWPETHLQDPSTHFRGLPWDGLASRFEAHRHDVGARTADWAYPS